MPWNADYHQKQLDILLPLSWPDGTRLSTEAELSAKLEVPKEPFWVDAAGEPLPEDLLQDFWNINELLKLGVFPLGFFLSDLEAELVQALRTRTSALSASPTADEVSRVLASEPLRVHLLNEVLATREPIAHDAVENVRQLVRGLPWTPDRGYWEVRRNVTYLGALSNSKFQKYNDMAVHFKDPLVSTAHGEYSHRIQWWLIARAVEQGYLKLGKGPDELFKALSRYYTEPTFIRNAVDRRDPSVDLMRAPGEPLLNALGEQTSIRRLYPYRLAASLWLCLVDRLPSSDLLVATLDGKEQLDARTPVQFSGAPSKWVPGGRPVLDTILSRKFRKLGRIERVWKAQQTQASLEARARSIVGAPPAPFVSSLAYAADRAQAAGYTGSLPSFLLRYAPTPPDDASAADTAELQQLTTYLLEKYWPRRFKVIATTGMPIADAIRSLPAEQQAWLLERARDRILEPGARPPGWTLEDKFK